MLAAGFSQRQVAKKLGVSQSTLSERLSKSEPTQAPDFSDDFEEIQVVHRDYSHLDSLRVYPLGDVHKGSRAHDRNRWRDWMAFLCSRKDVSLLNTGDNFNAALKDSKSESYDETMTVGTAKRELAGELKPLAADGRIDCLTDGNHEDRIYRAVGDSPNADLAYLLDVPYVRAAALFVYQVGDVEYKVYMRHGTGNGQSAAQLAKSGAVIEADVYVTGHIHRMIHTVDDFFRYENGALARVDRHFVSSGSFLRYEAYAAQRGYVPGRIGAPRIRLDGRVRDIHSSI